MSESSYDKIKKVIKITNKVSSTFCLAKWHHVTMYLQTGETHSCYHPPPHSIPLEELKTNPSVLHNTPSKKLERKQMLEGTKPAGCQYCWNIEGMGKDYISDRHIKNSSIYTDQRFKQATQESWDQNINPEYIEINFGNECNFKCGYCHPKYSSRFYNEIKEFGPVTSVKNHRCDINWLKLYQREEKNPYVDAFWQWWPELRNTLNIMRITGGEPTLHKSTWYLLEELEKNPMPNLNLNINSNLGTKSSLIEKLSLTVQDLYDNKKIKDFKLFTSIDTWGERAEYIRTGLDLKLWEKNFHTYLQNTKFPVSFMITFNILCVTSFKSLLEKILEWRSQYEWYDDKKEHRIKFDTPYLKEPLQYDINILPKKEFMPFMYEALTFMKDNLDDSQKNKFTTVEYEKFKRVVDYMETTNYSPDKILEGRKDFYNWFKEIDNRRGIQFEKTFPEMISFYEKCKLL